MLPLNILAIPLNAKFSIFYQFFSTLSAMLALIRTIPKNKSIIDNKTTLKSTFKVVS